MPRLLAILLTLLPALFASGEAVTAVRELGANDVRTCLRHVSPAEGGNVSISGDKRDKATAPRQHRKAMSVQSYRLNRPTAMSLSHGGARMFYDYTFRTPDPCAEKFYWLSPYSYCAGDPVNYTDPTGMIPEWLMDTFTRCAGVVQAGLGGFEMAVGGTLCGSGIGSVLGAALVVHGADNVVTGATIAITGEDRSTVTAQAVTAGAEACGASPEVAMTIGVAADIAIDPAAAGKKAVIEGAKVVNATAKAANTVRKNYKMGKAAEKIVKGMTGGKSKFLNTPLGGRQIDAFVEDSKEAHEVKVGRVSATQRIRQQVQKDVWLRGNGDINEIHMDFFRSPITGQQGPTKPLQDLLEKNNIHINYIDY